MLSARLIQQIRHIELKAGRLVTEALAGEYSSVFRGMGMEFDKVREYEPGDDVRSIDWNVTARARAPYVKVFREERELTLMLIVDVSASQRFGSGGVWKQELATELAAVLAFLAKKNNDKVGLILFSDHVETFIPPKKGRSHVWNIIKHILSFEAKGRSTDLKGALDFFLKMMKKRSLCFLLSDFYTQEYEKVLPMAAYKHDLICVRTRDPQERQLSASGFWNLEDAETGEHLNLNLSDAKLRKTFESLVRHEEQKQIEFFRRHKIDTFDLGTEASVVPPLVRYLHLRERRLRMR